MDQKTNPLLSATPDPSDFGRHAPRFSPENTYRKLRGTLQTREGLTDEGRDLALRLWNRVYTGLLRHDMVKTLAGIDTLIDLRESGPEEKKFRKDGNSTYTHELAQIAYLLWTMDRAESVVGRIACVRAGMPYTTPIKKLPVNIVETVRAQLAEELSRDEADKKGAASALHDVIEDCLRHLGMDDARAYLVDQLNARLGNSEDNIYIVDSVYHMTRRIMPDGNGGFLKEKGMPYVLHLLGNMRATECKGRDGEHNVATILNSGMSIGDILLKLDEREMFCVTAMKQYGGQSPLIEYHAIYEQDQTQLLREYLTGGWQKDKKVREELKEWLADVKDAYGTSTIDEGIHPMYQIVIRIEHGMAAFDNGCAPGQDPAVVPLHRPQIDSAPPKPRRRR